MTTTTNSARGSCSGTNRRGEPCNASPLVNRAFCFFHDPEQREARVKAARRGGKARHGRNIGETGGDDLPTVSLDTVADVLAYLSKAASDLAKLENSVSRARAMTQLASVAVDMLKAGQIEERVAALEAMNGKHY